MDEYRKPKGIKDKVNDLVRTPIGPMPTTASSRNPSLRERTANFIMGENPSPVMRRFGENATTLAEFATPFGLVTMADDVARAPTADDAAKTAMMGVPALKVGAKAAGAVASTAGTVGRELDALGYYSQALESAKGLVQAKGTPEQMLAQLKSAGVKDAEIEATGLRSALDGKKSVTRDEIVAHLEANRVGVKEVVRGREDVPREVDSIIDHGRVIDPGDSDAGRFEYAGRYFMDRDDAVAAAEDMEVAVQRQGGNDYTKWSDKSLDPSNPTYRETVLHLPDRTPQVAPRGRIVQHPSYPDQKAIQYDDGTYLTRGDGTPKFFGDDESAQLWINNEVREATRDAGINVNFRSNHFPEPNIVGHMMTSMTKHEGKPVYTVDQIQSDWGQKLRDGGVRDEAKIADLQKQIDEQNRMYADTIENEIKPLFVEAGKMPPAFPNHAIADMRALARFYEDIGSPTKADAIREQERRLLSMQQPITLLGAELRTAEASTPGNPLVNTTDQWTNTTLRRALQQAAEADADNIAIPSGRTVLSYNPGDENGMAAFYDMIVPKNLRNILSKEYGYQAPPQRVDQLETPTNGLAGQGFTLFSLPPELRAKIIKDGGRLFAVPATVGAAAVAGNAPGREY
jgi:hypothetical protein